jgi:hypothetical protein
MKLPVKLIFAIIAVGLLAFWHGVIYLLTTGEMK